MDSQYGRCGDMVHDIQLGQTCLEVRALPPRPSTTDMENTFSSPLVCGIAQRTELMVVDVFRGKRNSSEHETSPELREHIHHRRIGCEHATPLNKYVDRSAKAAGL